MPKESDAALEARIQQLVIPVLSDNGHIPQVQWRPVYAWDLDSTVASTVHRRHMVEAIRAGESGVTWDDYAMQCSDDAPIAGSVALMHELAGGLHVAVSGRSGKAEALTWAWFEEHDVPFAAALLRIEGDHTPNGTYKVRVLRAMRALGISVRLFFEDWHEVAQQVEAEVAIPVVGINPFDPEEFPAKVAGV